METTDGKMKILIFNWRDIKNPDAGGAEVHLHEIFKRIILKGHEVTLISSKFENCKDSEIIDGIKTIRIGNKFNFNITAPIYYIRKLRNQTFDIVIDDISKIPICSPIYINEPMIGIIHHIHGDTLFKELNFIMASYVWLSEKLLIPLYKNKNIVSVSDSTKKELIKMGMLEKNIAVIHNGNNHFEQTESILSSDKSKIPTIIYVGRVKMYKQLDHLIKTFSIVRNDIKNCKLIIAGKGKKKYLKNIASDLGLNSSVEFYDELSENKKLELLRNAWIFVSPSMKEGWGITVIEANACGTPAIGYNVPGLKDSIIHGYNGLLVKDGDIVELAKTIINVLNDEKLRDKMSIDAIKWSKNFDWDKSTEEFEKIMIEKISYIA